MKIEEGRNMVSRLKEIDLRFHMRLGIEHAFNTLDERRDYLPFFSYQLVQKPIQARHGTYDSPHVVGRFLDILSLCAPIIELPGDPRAQKGLADLLHRSFASEDGLAWNEPTNFQKRGAVTHNQREALLGLIALMKWKGCERSAALAQRLCRSIQRITDKTGGFPGICYKKNGFHFWEQPPSPPGYTPPWDCGRLIGALVKYYRISSDPVALELAKKFTDLNLKTVFDDGGSFTESAGAHVHSITGTIASILDLGLLLNDANYIKKGRLAYDVGVKPYRSSYGWVKERTDNDYDRGEANNTGDLIEAALSIAKSGVSTYFEDAERMIRNHLLTSQLIEIARFEETGDMKDTIDFIYSGVAIRARGGFCFSSPNDFLGYPDELYQINSDLVGGAVRALCEAWDSIITQDRLGVRVNLLFSKDTDTLSFKSHIPQQGKLEIRMRKPAHLFVRIPSWVDQKDLMLNVEGQTRSISMSNCYLLVPDLGSETKVEVRFPLKQLVISEEINQKTYEVEWLGDTVTSVFPKGTFMPLY